MGKQGPCCHCGISTTPLWRNGPPDKPVLCNACGSRWRTKGTLVNYMPMHLTGCGGKSNSADLKFPRGKKGSHKSIEQRSHKRKEPCDGHGDFAYGFQKSDLNVFKSFEEDASTRSSTGSGISYSEGCIQHSGGMGENFSGFWILGDCRVPSKKRTSMYRHGPAQAKVTQMQSALYDFDSSVLDYPSEEDLLVEYKPSSMAAEIGLGGVFIRQPTLAEKEQESEASSLKFESKNHSHFQALRPESPRAANSSVQIREESDKNMFVCGKEIAKPTPNNADIGRIYSDKSCMPNKALLENFPYNKRDVLQSSQSPLVFLELKDIVNFDTFVGLLTDQEQLQLMKYVSSADFSRTPESLRRMFNSAQFESSLANIQLLLSEGMFDASDSGLNPRVLQHYQQLLTLTDLTGSGWMEQCSQIFNRNKRRGPVEFKAMQGKEFLREKISVPGAAEASALTAFGALTDSTERSFGHANIGADMDYVGSMKNNISVQRKSSPISVFADVSFGKNCQAFEQRSKQRGTSLRDTPVSEKGGNSGSCISSNSFYCLSVEKDSPGQCGIIEALVDEGSEPDILLDLPSNMTFQQAELLQQPSWNKSFSTKGPGTDGDLKLDDSGTLVALNTWHAEDNLDWAGLLWNPASTGTGSISGNLLNSRKMFL